MNPTLRITQTTAPEGKYHVEIAFEGDGLPRQAATASFAFETTTQDQKDLRWYLEDYLQFPQDPAPVVAARVERGIAKTGTELFKALFHSSDDARDLWATLRTHLENTDVQIITSVQEATSIPWELIRDPKTDTPLALRARAFVRAHPQAAERPKAAKTGKGPIRILLVICRPGAKDDVPFRSVAGRLIKGLSEEARALFQLDVLRPPTFEQLGRVLRHAQAKKEPYHVVHFDGHGLYLDAEDKKAPGELLRSLMPLLLCGPRTGAHGYLAFENPALEENTQLVNGPALGKLLVEANVPVLVLNACRSAHAETPEDTETDVGVDEPHAQVRALGSLAQEVMDAGVTGVVAMRYNVYVVTAAQFVAELYATLTQGWTLGQAVTLGRKQLANNPLRQIAYDPLPLQDWSVPVVYEAAPIALFPKAKKGATPTITIDAGGASAEAGSLDAKLPKPPDVGFFGRDETLLALDRAFDTQRIVLLHAYAGSGKTTTAAEFARWYSLTGGVQGPVLFTSFEQYLPLPRVLDRIGDVFGAMLEQAGENWLALDEARRRDVALQVLSQIPVLWIWDNVEPVAGFPAAADSTYSDEEQGELVDFLRDAQQTKAKFLLTSRRDERKWLGSELPRRIAVPPMPMQERVQLARALAEKHDHRITDVDDWRPLLRFTQGNPLTITVLVGQALRDGLKTREQIEAFVDKLRRGEAAFEDEADQGRSRSLGASLDYGFASAFTDAERKQLACLHFFQGFVDVDALKMMGNPETDWCLPELRGLNREAGTALLDRAAEVGLLTAHGGGYYTIHPALPWFFRSLFDRFYGDEKPRPETGANRQSEIENRQSQVARAFVAAMGGLGNYYAAQYEGGNRGVIAALVAEEANLLHGRRLARSHGWWHPVTATMQGLRQLYAHTGRRAEWWRLVEEIVPDFVDPTTDGPLPGREEDWGLVTEYRVRLAQQSRQWAEAERLQSVCVAWDRRRAAPGLEQTPQALDKAQRHAIRTLAVSLGGLGSIQRELEQAECVRSYQEALNLSERISDRAAAAVCAFNLGHAYKNLSAIRDLTQAEDWYRRSLDLRDERDPLGRGGCYAQLGLVGLERFREARTAGQPEAELLRHINAALESYQQALELTPADAVDSLAVMHNQLGMIYRNAGDIDRALPHYRESIRLEETQGNLYGAGQTRYNVALALAGAGRLEDAREYALAALRNYETYGAGAAEKIQKTQRLIADIEQAVAKGGAA